MPASSLPGRDLIGSAAALVVLAWAGSALAPRRRGFRRGGAGRRSTPHRGSTRPLAAHDSGLAGGAYRPPGQQASQAQLTARAPSPQALSRVERLTCGRDTLGQITCLAVALRRWRQTPGGPAIGSVILVTGQEHLSRALAIAQVVLGGQGLAVTGFPADTKGVPEDPLRKQRDRLRAQLWRATGWDGRPSFLSSEG